MTTDNYKPYILWRRVSTKEQGASGLGLEAQLAIARKFYGEPTAIYTDVHSGTCLRECKQLQAAKRHSKDSGQPIVIAKCDRVRNVIQGLELLDEVGEGNLIFCDVGTVDRTILTMMFAIYEKQAIIGRINTKLALDERKRQIKEQGFFVSKAGNICYNLGNADGCDMSKAVAAAAALAREEKLRWETNSQAVKFVLRKRAEGWGCTQITEELQQLYDDNANADNNPYSTREGCRPTKGQVSRWSRLLVTKTNRTTTIK